MPEANQLISEMAFTSFIGSAGRSFAAGKVRDIQTAIATFSVRGSPSITSTGTLCLGLTFRYSGLMCWPLPMFSGSTSNSAPASVRLMYGTIEQAIGA